MKHAAVAWSFGKSNKSFYNSVYSPGPGAYNSSQITSYRRKEPHWKLGTASRSKSYSNLVPGPGNYNLEKPIGSNAPKFTMRPKTGTNFESRNKDLPGPGHYNPDLKKKDNFSYTMRIRPQSASNLMNNPGPGNYHLRKGDNDFLKTHSYRFGSEKKHKEPNFTYLKNPGPGNYDFNNPFATKSPPKFSFGKEPRGVERRPKTPGPGTYEAKKVMGNEGPKISMSFNRPATAFRNETPGPGTYMPALTNKNKSPEYKIGTSKREIVNKEAKMKPGPGAYEGDKIGPTKSKAPQWVIGKEQRGYQMNSNRDNPGPGNYEYKKTIGEAPKVSYYS